jgi:hypothetical protein
LDKNDKPNEKEDEQEITLSFAQFKGKCYCCGKPGHRLRRVPTLPQEAATIQAMMG